MKTRFPLGLLAFTLIRPPGSRRARLAGLFLITAVSAVAQTNYSQLHVFGDPNLMAGSPYGNVLEGSDGAFYGTTAGGGVPGYGTVFKMNKDGTGFQVLYEFGATTSDGRNPHAALAQGLDGALYGTTAQGGTNHPGSFYNGAGTLFKLKLDGGGYTVLHQFGGTDDGVNPQATLIQAGDGALYGTTFQGGTNSLPSGGGTVFKLNPDGSGYTVLHHFGSTGDGKSPLAALLEGSGHALYGTTSQGGTNSSSGTLFTMNAAGTSYAILRHFGGTGDGKGPFAALVEGTDHLLYGTTAFGGTNGGYGTLFSISKQGDVYNMLRSFDNLSGSGVYIHSGLIEGQDGKLYGASPQTTTSSSSGNVFVINKDGAGFGIIHTFGGTVDGASSPTATLLQTSDGTLYGSTRAGGQGFEGTVFKLNTDGGNYAVLRIFSSTAGDGGNPYAGLTKTADGTLYGTVDRGGVASQGAVFKLNQDGSGYSLVFSFGVDTNGGSLPLAPLLLGSDNALYGTTDAGAAPGKGNNGTVFKLNPDGTGHTVLYSFAGAPNDGYGPQSGVIEGSGGALFGTTTSGGSNGFSGGVLYQLQKNGSNYAVVHQFGATNVHDGIGPIAGALVEASDHAVYGLTGGGGSHGSGYGDGTLYRVNQDGTGYTIVYNFDGTIGGTGPSALMQGSEGPLYGTMGGGGTNGGFFGGTVFKLNKDGTGYSTLHNFGAPGDGTVPRTLMEGPGGMLYGTTLAGGSFSGGTVFKVSKDGTGYAVLYHFGSSATDGNSPYSDLVIGNNGTVFGTTQKGGFSLGTIYSLSNTGTSLPIDVSIQSNHGITISFSGVPLHSYQVEASDKVAPATWLSIVTQAAAADGSFLFTDTDAPNHSTRFYRIQE